MNRSYRFLLSPSRCGQSPRLFLFWALLGLALGLQPLGSAEPTRRLFDLPAGPAETTLRLFADQAAGQFLFSVDKVTGVRTPALKGEYAAHEALDRLVAGTELRPVRDERTGALTVDRMPAGGSAGAKVAMSGTGAIEGRVFNASVGNYVNNARVIIDGLRLETFTDEYGNYSFPRVPAGAATVRVFYTGFPAEAQVVAVVAGGRAEGNFSLRSDKGTSDTTVVLDAFTVAATRDMAASDIAVNEQRYFAGIKNVVAADSFGDIAEGNVGEFAKFLPGVTLARNGSDGVNISLGGVPPSSTPIMVDGNSLASASSSNASRTIELEQVSITSMSRVEITRSQNPDSPANAIGGTVNLVSKSAFERRQPEYAVKTYLSFRGGDFRFSKQPNPFNKRDYPFEPNVEFSAVVPLTKNFGFTASGLVTRALNNGQGSLMTWVPNGAAQSTNFPATPVDQPYLVRYRLQERPKITVRENISLSADWRVAAGNVLTFGFQYAYYTSAFWVRQLLFDVGRVASFGPDFTQGAAGAGFAQIIYDAREKTGTTYMPSIRYKHTGPVWQWQTGGAFSRASNHYRAIDKGFFQNNNAYYRNLTMRFEQIDFDHPGVVSVKDATGRDADPYTLSNYRLESLSSLKYDGVDIVRSLYGFAKRDFDFRLPLTVKAGLDFRSQSRDMRRPTTNTAYVGADRIAQSVDDSASQWYDPVYGTRDMLYGPKMQWMDLSQIGNTYRTNPDYFTTSVTNAVNDYRSGVTTSQAITETITAPYLRLDTRLFNGRLQLTGGVRYERTDDVGDGPLVDPTRIYQRNASGQIVRDAAGRPVVVAALATLAGTQLAYIERGSSVEKTYNGFFPSLNGTFMIRSNLIARFSYGRSISRPDFGNILPSANLPDPEGTGRTITLTNPSLKPWSADSYGVALEYYFNEPSTGVLSARLYRRDIKDFWGSSIVPATDELLEPWGLDPTVYGEALGYLVSTQVNVGSARVSGMEFDYRQNLAFLPRWARGFTVFANMTLQHLEGSQRASFGGFVAKTTNCGVTYSRARLTVRLAVNLKGTVRQGQITNVGTEPGTFTYLKPRNSADLSAEYRFTRKFSVFVGGRNINEAIDDTVIYGPNTPRDRSLSGRADYRAYWNVGLKGTF